MPPKKYIHGQYQAKLAAARAWKLWISERAERLRFITYQLKYLKLTASQRDDMEFEALMLQGTIATATRELRK